MQSCSARARYKLLGVEVEALTIPELNQLVSSAVTKQAKWIIANHNLHSIYLYHHDEEMQEFFRKSFAIHVDGMSVILIGRLLGQPLRRENRITYVDWIGPLMSEAARQNWRTFYLGSKPGVSERGAEILGRQYPGLQIQCAHGYFQAERDSPENQALLQRIRLYRPHILMVGMGMPRQERWILQNLDQIEANAILTAGGCMDYVAGVVPTPPRWMGAVGLEWLYRLHTEPGRMWRRYLAEPWFVARLLMHDIWRQRMFRRNSP